MKSDDSSWICDQRYGIIAVYRGPQHYDEINKNDSECLFYAHGKQMEPHIGCGWVIDPKDIRTANLIADELNARSLDMQTVLDLTQWADYTKKHGVRSQDIKKFRSILNKNDRRMRTV